MFLFGPQMTPVLGTNALTQNIQFGQHLLLTGSFSSSPTISLPNLPNQNGGGVVISNTSNYSATIHGNVPILGLNTSGDFTLATNAVVMLMAVSLTSPTTNNWYVMSSDSYAAPSSVMAVPSATFAGYSGGPLMDFGTVSVSVSGINGSLDVPTTHANNSHNLGRTPAVAISHPRNLLYKSVIKNMTSTTFDVQVIDVLTQGNGIQYANPNLTVDWILIG